MSNISLEEAKARALIALVNEADTMDRSGDKDKSVDHIFEGFDTLLTAGEFECINSFLSAIEVEIYTTDVLISLLIITAAAKRELPSRQFVKQSVEHLIETRGEREKDLLIGL